MKRIVLHKVIAGPGGVFSEGAVVEFDDRLAALLVADGCASWVGVETAAIEAPEMAVAVKTVLKKPGQKK